MFQWLTDIFGRRDVNHDDVQVHAGPDAQVPGAHSAATAILVPDAVADPFQAWLRAARYDGARLQPRQREHLRAAWQTEANGDVLHVLAGEDAAAFDAWLAANGYDATQLPAQSRMHLQAAWQTEASVSADGEQQGYRGGGHDRVDHAEAQRRAGIEAAFARCVQTTGGRPMSDDGTEQADQHAIRFGWSVARFEAELQTIVTAELDRRSGIRAAYDKFRTAVGCHAWDDARTEHADVHAINQGWTVERFKQELGTLVGK